MQEFGGISKYFVELIQGINGNSDHQAFLPGIYSNNEYLSRLGYLRCRPFLKSLKFKGKDRILWKINQHLNDLSFKKYKWDIIHPTFVDSHILNYKKAIPFVMTIHDMTHEMWPESFSKSDDVRDLKRALAVKARKIIAISENTKRDIIRIYGKDIKEEDVHVVHHGLNFSDNRMNDIPFNLPENFILFIGGRAGYKNFDLLLHAFKNLNSCYPDIHLVCVGGGRFIKSETIRIREMNLNDVVHHISVRESELSAVYQSALSMVYPSINEGFGLTILEAFDNKCPVILANASCFPEIADNAALYFDPYSVRSLASTLIDFCDHRLEYIPEMIERGTERLTHFTHQRMINNTIVVYEAAYS